MIQNSLILSLIFSAALAFADSSPVKIKYVGSISIQPSQDAKVLADWYSNFGLETKKYDDGGYYGMLNMASGPFYFAIHAKDKDAPAKSSASVAAVFAIENYDESLNSLKSKGILPTSIEADDTGKFAHFADPDGNPVTIWEPAKSTPRLLLNSGEYQNGGVVIGVAMASDGSAMYQSLSNGTTLTFKVDPKNSNVFRKGSVKITIVDANNFVLTSGSKDSTYLWSHRHLFSGDH